MQEIQIDHRNIFKWNTISNITNLGSKFVITVILQLLLQPADFGIIASILVFAGLAQVFVDNGFQSAIIQARNVSANGLSTAFFINVGVGFVCTLILFLLAPALGDFFNEPRLVPVTRLIAFTYLLQSTVLVQRALLTRTHAFKKLAIADIGSNLLAGIIAILMAMKGYGVWSIAAMYVLQVFICNIFLWWQSGWRPGLVFDWQEVKGIWSYGSKVFLSGLFIYANSRIDLLLTGRFFTAAQQGFYSRGKDYGMLPSGILISILSKSYFPIFSRLQDEPEPLKKNYLNALSAVSFIGGLIFPLLFLVAGDAVMIVLKQKWADMIPVLDMFIIFSAIHVFNSVNSNFLAATGKAKTSLFVLVVMGCIRMAVILSYFIMTPSPDMLIVILMLIIFSFVENHLTFYYIRKYNGYSLAKQYAASYKEMITGWVIAGALYLFSAQVDGLNASPVVHVVFATILFVLLYAVACYFTRSFYFVNWFSRLKLVK